MVAGIVHLPGDAGCIDKRADTVPVVQAASFCGRPLLADKGVDGRRHPAAIVEDGGNDRFVRVPIIVTVLLGRQAHEDGSPVDGRSRRHDGPFTQRVGALFHHHFYIGHLVQHFAFTQGFGGNSVRSDKDNVFGLRTGGFNGERAQQECGK